MSYKVFFCRKIIANSITAITLYLISNMSFSQVINSGKIIPTNIDSVHQKIIYQAMDLAKQEYTEKTVVAPEKIRSIGYQQYRSIRFLTDKALWKNNALFEVQFFHPGFLYQQPVTIKEVITDNITNIPFSSTLFRYDGEAEQIKDIVTKEMGFSGLRIHYPLNTKSYKDELIVFQGASYFRPLGPSYQYGASARALAIDTAEASGEEFPYFKEFWLVKPSTHDNSMTLYALLDSPSVTGAYRFDLLPGVPTKIKVNADIFARKAIDKLGIAPLTSMFFYGENRFRHPDDFRPEVHDSDGLLIATENDEWIWRPLSNSKELHVSSFSLNNPKGFGLMQRDREFDHYQDTEANYHRRPSLWIQPEKTSWGKGKVELVEIPTGNETNDNIVAYWVPEKKLAAGDKKHFEYTMTIIDSPNHNSLGKVIQTRNGWASVPGQDNPPPRSHRQFIVDFSGWPEGSLADNFELKPQITLSSGNVYDLQVNPLPDKKTWRASFKLAPEGNTPVDISLHLSAHNQRLTETWSYVWYPNNIQH